MENLVRGVIYLERTLARASCTATEAMTPMKIENSVTTTMKLVLIFQST